MVSLNLPFEIVTIAGVIIVAAIGAAFYFGDYYFSMKRNNPELHVFQKARKFPFPPIITMVDPTGRQMHFNGEKERKEDAKLSNTDYGLLCDPLIVGKLPHSALEDGTRQYFYGTGFYLPVDPNGARTIVQLIHKIRKEYPKLNFIRDDVTLIELLFKSGTDISVDIETVIKLYPLENYVGTTEMTYDDITVDKLVAIFEEIKGKLKKWKVEPGWFSIHDGLALLPIGTGNRDMGRLEAITKMNTINDVLKEPSTTEALLKIVVIVGGLLVLAYMIIVNVKPGGG